MKKTIFKILLRKINRQLAIFFSIVFVVALTIAFFVAVKTVYIDFDKNIEKYFKSNMLYNTVLLGFFDEDDLLKVKEIESVADANIKHKFDSYINTTKTDGILYSTKNENTKINIPYIHEGKDILDTNEIRLNKNYADANNLKLGDEIELKILDETNTFKIASLSSYPNHIFLFKSRASTVSDAKDLAIIEINEDYFTNKYIPYNTLYINYEDGIDKDKVIPEIKDLLKDKIYLYSDVEQSLNYANYKQALSQINSFSYIMPIILLIMACLLIYVVQRRNVSVERKQIGIMKALGLSDISILFLYLKYSFIVVLTGITVAYIIIEITMPLIFNSLTSLFDVPNFVYEKRYLSLWIISSSIMFIVFVLSNFLAALSILKITPAEAMRGVIPKGGKKLFFENFRFWSKLTFNTRYAIKTAFRGKTRYFVSLWSMFSAVVITIFAQGFNNSFDYFIDSLFNNFALYDISVNINDTPIDENTSFIEKAEEEKIDFTYDKVSIYQAKISHAFLDNKEYTVDNPALIYDTNFSSLNIPINTNSDDSVMLSQSIAKRIGVKEGDFVGVEIYMPGKTKFKRLKVNNIVEQTGMFFVYISRKCAEKHFDIPNTYNTVYIKTDNKNMENILNDDSNAVYHSLKSLEEESSKKQIATITILVRILLIVAFLLGAFSLYGVGIVTLATRRYEFTLLKVMGYSTSEIMLASIKETISQVIIAIPTGIVVGISFLYMIKDSFSSNFFDFSPHIYKESYLSAIVLLFFVIIFVNLITARYINNLDMVEGLKEREE